LERRTRVERDKLKLRMEEERTQERKGFQRYALIMP
jgi:hypothetical protein